MVRRSDLLSFDNLSPHRPCLEHSRFVHQRGVRSPPARGGGAKVPVKGRKKEGARVSRKVMFCWRFHWGSSNCLDLQCDSIIERMREGRKGGGSQSRKVNDTFITSASGRSQVCCASDVRRGRGGWGREERAGGSASGLTGTFVVL